MIGSGSMRGSLLFLFEDIAVAVGFRLAVLLLRLAVMVLGELMLFVRAEGIDGVTAITEIRSFDLLLLRSLITHNLRVLLLLFRLRASLRPRYIIFILRWQWRLINFTIFHFFERFMTPRTFSRIHRLYNRLRGLLLISLLLR